VIPPCRHCRGKKAWYPRGLCWRCFGDRGVRGLYPLDPRPVLPTVCRHCARGKVNRPRGLCWGCYYAPGVKSLYPTDPKYGRRGAGNGNGRRPLPAAPTTAAPGTPEKVEVMRQRAERNEVRSAGKRIDRKHGELGCVRRLKSAGRKGASTPARP
jgi:hypothetical protein